MSNPILQESNNHLSLLHELTLFCEVVRTGSFTGAASSRDVTVSTMTRGIQRLEKAIGVKLFVRTTRRVTLTDEGLSLYQRCLPGVRSIQDAMLATQRSQRTPGGLIRVTSASIFGHRHIAPIVNQFMLDHPDISIEFSLDDQFRDMGEDGLDVAIRGGRISGSRLIARKIADMPMYICGAPAYLERHGKPKNPEELIEHRCIRFVFQGTQKEMLWEFCREGELYPIGVPGGYVVNNNEVACEAACAGIGLVQLPGYIAVPEIRRGRLQPVLMTFLDSSRAFYLCYQDRLDVLPKRIQLFAEYLLANVGPAEQFALSKQESTQFLRQST